LLAQFVSEHAKQILRREPDALRPAEVKRLVEFRPLRFADIKPHWHVSWGLCTKPASALVGYERNRPVLARSTIERPFSRSAVCMFGRRRRGI